MECKNLYRVQEKDLDRLREILTICFKNDPLYSALIEDQETRERLMPHLFSCDVTECFETCEVYADSEELKGILIVSDESDHRHAFYNYFVSLKESLVTDGFMKIRAQGLFGILCLEKIISTRHGRHSFIRPGGCM